MYICKIKVKNQLSEHPFQKARKKDKQINHPTQRNAERKKEIKNKFII